LHLLFLKGQLAEIAIDYLGFLKNHFERLVPVQLTRGTTKSE